MTSDRLRAEFLNFFKKKRHKIIPSDSLVPRGDPTLLFTGAGMNQFKNQFLGRNITFTRAATCQKCLRTADLEKVGKTGGHHTFFEMLGNFSFGDYFKKEAIEWGWEFLTVTLGIHKEKLWASVYEEDRDSYDIWKSRIGLSEPRIVKLGDKENFWPAEARKNGPNGPCGPCSEMFYDWGADAGCGKAGCDPSCDCGRFVEVWNLVFTQFNRLEGGTLKDLPKKNIDTGMGLERLAAVVEQVRTNFHIDSFKPLTEAVAGRINYEYGADSRKDSHINAIADHARAITFAMGDGVRPSNEARGFVIRKLIRKASQHARSIGIEEAFIYKMVSIVAKVAKKPYPELTKMTKDTSRIVLGEEESLRDMVEAVLPDMEGEFSEIKKRGRSSVAGELIFKYYDEKGIPMDLIEEEARAQNLGLDMDGFNRLLEEQRRRSRGASKVGDSIFVEKFLSEERTEFIQDSASIETTITALSEEDGRIHVALEKTVFYGESGGQVGDRGVIEGAGFKIEVEDAKRFEDTIDHIGRLVEGQPRVGQKVKATIDLKRRHLIIRNHTATHLLHAALKKVLGKHVSQYGSLVAPERLRFDFTHPSKLRPDEIKKVEGLVNEFIKSNFYVESKKMGLGEAKKYGAIALFGEKYKDQVTVRTIGGISKELCGGTHVEKTKEIGAFKIIKESSVASGVRRIEALTGEAVHNWVKEDMGKKRAYRKKSLAEAELKEVQKRKKKEKALDYKSSLDRVIKEAVQIKDIKVISKEIKDADADDLRRFVDMIKRKTGRQTFVVLASSEGDRVSMVAGLTEDLSRRGLDAVRMIKEVARVVGGGGGGRPDLAQAGGRDPDKLKKALGLVYIIVEREVSR